MGKPKSEGRPTIALKGILFRNVFEQISFFPGRVTFNDPYFDPDKPVDKQLDVLRQDLFQAELGSGLTLDVGWYPCFDRNGRFRLVLIKDAQWDAPLVSFETRVCGELVTKTLEILRRPEFAGPSSTLEL